MSVDPILYEINLKCPTCPSSSSFKELKLLYSLEIPQKLHPYVYVGNNPVNYIDPKGEIAWPIIGCALACSICIAQKPIKRIVCNERCKKSLKDICKPED